MVNEETVLLWGVVVSATWGEESSVPLSALNDNVLIFFGIEFEPLGYLSRGFEILWVSFNGRNNPVLSVMSVESFSVVSSPFVKRNPEFTLVGISKISLLFPFFSPEIRVLRPWSGIFGESPWVSHLNELVNAFSICGKAETLEDSICVTSNEVVMTLHACGSHWVSIFGTVQNDFPKFIISHLAGLVG